MMKICVGRIFLFILIVLIAQDCKEPYTPPVSATNTNYLVVDGIINYLQDSTIITLSRTRGLSEPGPNQPELNAQVTVEGQQMTDIFPLNELGNGRYGAPVLNLNLSEKYRINIVTTDGRQYVSDFVPINETPPIDSLSWQKSNDGVHISVTTHDPLNNTRYYRWAYEETWEYHAAFESLFQYQNGSISFRNPSQAIFICYRSQSSSNIFLGSSVNLAQDEIFMKPLVIVPIGSEQITVNYSLLVKQYAITRDAYDYWTNLKNSTENVGGLFDPQPSQVTGNIHAVNHPTEPVLGYISAGASQQSRIFINNQQVLPWDYPQGCMRISVPSDSLDIYFGQRGYIPLDALLPPGAGYTGTLESCGDCTLQGGSIIKPPFWP